MKKTREQLETIANIINSTYNGNGKRIRESKIEFSPEDSLGYSFKTDDSTEGRTLMTYTVVYSDLGPDKEYTSFRIKMHEYGHVYCNHFDLHEEYDKNVAEALKNYRGQIIDAVNKNCDIDFGEKLVERVLDDPQLNHQLHNIAMDFEVNSKILSDDDVVEMEEDISELLAKSIEERFEYLKNSVSNEEMKQKIDEEVKRAQNESKIKLMLPCRYHDKNGIPFPNGLTYGDYLIKIIMNLDQFVKMLVDINNGGMGDTSNVTSDQVKNALKGGMQSLNDLMKNAGMLDDSGDEEKEGDSKEGEGNKDSKLGNHDTSNSGGFKGDGVEKDYKYKGIRRQHHQDHMSPSREISDKKRELGEITAGGGFGCGDGGGPEGKRVVRESDEVDLAIDEVIDKTRSRVVKRQIKRDIIRNYNLGKNRSVIAPSIIARNRIDKTPKLVYIIDISVSMDTELIDRILSTIARKMKSINRGLKYDILTWSHAFGDWIQNIEPGKPIPSIHSGGGTRMADALRFFAEKYDSSATYIMISDFEDHLEEWREVIEEKLSGYTGWGFNYGRQNYGRSIEWPSCFQVRNFNETYVGKGYYF